jgi:hypothetical protein
MIVSFRPQKASVPTGGLNDTDTPVLLLIAYSLLIQMLFFKFF